jgi:8-oxo-dGTP pyrophosphatase MutT (NUDIX family)
MDVDAPNDIVTVSSEVVYQNPWLSMREDKIRRADGSEGTYAVVDKPDFALVIPFENDGFWLIEQYRYPVAHRSWEFPQGTFPTGQIGSDEELARKELREETGITAKLITPIGRLHSAKGLSSQAFTVWLAHDLTHGEPDREVEEQDMRQRWLHRAELDAMIRSGHITDDATLAAYLLWILQHGD